MEKIKVAFIFAALGGGGAQRQFGHLLNHINRDKFRPIIISIGRTREETISFTQKHTDAEIENNPELAKIDFKYYYLYRHLKYKEDIYFVSKYHHSRIQIQKQLYRLIIKIRPDISLSISPYATGISILPMTLSNVKHRIQCVRSNEMLFEHRWRFSTFIYWFIKKWITTYIVNSNDLKSKMKKNGFGNKNIITIYNGVPVFYEIQEKFNYNKIVNIAYIARLHKVKNHKMLFDAAASITTNKKFLIHIYGTGELENELKEYAKRKNIIDKVIFEGWKGNISSHLAEIDIVVLTSKGEGFNNSIAEAQMHGIPVVATNCTGSEEIVQNGKTGFVVAVDDTKEFAEKLRILINDDDIRIKYGQMAYKRSRQLFSVSKMVNNYDTFLSSIVEE